MPASGVHSHDSVADVGRADSWAIAWRSGMESVASVGITQQACPTARQHSASLASSHMVSRRQEIILRLQRKMIVCISCTRSLVRSFVRLSVCSMVHVLLAGWLAVSRSAVVANEATFVRMTGTAVNRISFPGCHVFAVPFCLLLVSWAAWADVWCILVVATELAGAASHAGTNSRDV